MTRTSDRQLAERVRRLEGRVAELEARLVRLLAGAVPAPVGDDRSAWSGIRHPEAAVGVRRTAAPAPHWTERVEEVGPRVPVAPGQAPLFPGRPARS